MRRNFFVLFQVSGFQSDGIGGSTTAAEKAKAQARKTLNTERASEPRPLAFSSICAEIQFCLGMSAFFVRPTKNTFWLFRYQKLRGSVTIATIGAFGLWWQQTHFYLLTVGQYIAILSREGELPSGDTLEPAGRLTSQEVPTILSSRRGAPSPPASQVEEARRRRSQNQAGHTKPSVQFQSSSIAGNDGAEGVQVNGV